MGCNQQINAEKNPAKQVKSDLQTQVTTKEQRAVNEQESDVEGVEPIKVQQNKARKTMVKKARTTMAKKVRTTMVKKQQRQTEKFVSQPIPYPLSQVLSIPGSVCFTKIRGNAQVQKDNTSISEVKSAVLPQEVDNPSLPQAAKENQSLQPPTQKTHTANKGSMLIAAGAVCSVIVVFVEKYFK